MKREFRDYIRTFLRRQNAANDQIEAKLDAEGWDGFAKFQAALFFLAVEHRFGNKIVHADIIKFVADMRAEVGPDGPKIDAEAAETLIKSIIDDSIDYDIAPRMIGTVQATTIYKVFSEAGLSDEDLDAVFDEAEALANRSAE